MQLDFRLFDLINGLAGRWAWADALGRGVAIYGLLAILLVVVGVAWAGHLPWEQRRRYLLSLLAAGLACALLYGLEALLAHHVLHHDLRSRPADSRWATVLVSEGTRLSFPAWPMVIAAALTLATWRIWRRVGAVLAGLVAALGVSLVFVGVQYPLDVVVGALAGVGIGLLVGPRPAQPAPSHRTMAAISIGLVGLLLAGSLFILFRPRADVAMPGAAGPGPRITPPAAAVQAVEAAIRPDTVTLGAATNGHLRVAAARVTTAPTADLPTVERLAKATVNAAFGAWPELDLLTVSVTAEFPGADRPRTGTLYTATVARTEWPAGGFDAAHALPGQKFYNRRYLTG